MAAMTKRKKARLPEGWFSWGFNAKCPRGHHSVQTSDSAKGREWRCLQCPDVAPTLIQIRVACCGVVRGEAHRPGCEFEAAAA